MAVRRPPRPGAAQEQDQGPELMEHLVKKSLDVNPGMRTGRDTGEVLKGLKEEAVARSQASGVASPRAKLSKEERKKQTIRFFFEQKQEEFSDEIADVLERERKLQEEKATIQATYADEIADFLGMMAGGADAPEAKEVVRAFRKFVAALGMTENDLIDRARRS